MPRAHANHPPAVFWRGASQAAQLKTWQLPHQQYSDSSQAAVSNRQRIIKVLAERLVLGDFESQMLCSADALDAALCAFASIAISRNLFSRIPSEHPVSEGWIAVHI